MWFWHNSKNDIFINLIKSKARNNNYYYYLELSYDDAIILNRVANAENDEL